MFIFVVGMILLVKVFDCDGTNLLVIGSNVIVAGSYGAIVGLNDGFDLLSDFSKSFNFFSGKGPYVCSDGSLFENGSLDKETFIIDLELLVNDSVFGSG
jgi:hypothetical protein